MSRDDFVGWISQRLPWFFCDVGMFSVRWMRGEFRRMFAVSVSVSVSVSVAGALIFPRVCGCGEVPLRSAIDQGASFVSLGAYRAREPESLGELPVKIRETVEQHLIARLGAEYYTRLKFSGGQIVDFDELYRVNPAARKFQWEIFAYRLRFTLSDPAKGIAAYDTAIGLDRHGKVIEEIALPQVRRHPQKAALISLADAYERAARTGLSPAQTDAAMDYDRGRDSLVFRLRQKIGDDGVNIRYRVADIDAHTGRLIRTSMADAIR